MRTALPLLPTALAVVLVVGACSTPGAPPRPPTSRPTSASGTTPPTGTATAPASPSGTPSTGQTGSPGSTASTSSSAPTPPVRLTGVVIEGLRPTCRVLQTDQRRWALVGPGTQALAQGRRVTVTGTPRPDLRNVCGTTFVVTAIG